jgi:uncharacterized protein (DUF362 family)
MRWLTDPSVALVRTTPVYPGSPPFHPGMHYPEAPFGDVAPASNSVYAGVRLALARLGLDAAHLGSPTWNPLGEFILPHDHVLLKPNLIRERHEKRDESEQVVTHGSVVRAILDYVVIAAGIGGRITIADGPQTDSDFDAIVRRTRLDRVVEFYRQHGIHIDLLDLRRERWFDRGEVIERREKLPGDPAGYATIDLGTASEFASYRGNGRFYGADYNSQETQRFHAGARHEYVLCRSALNADAVINLPKLKTHKKVGVTLSLKNLVGINGYRNCLPHHTSGTPEDGGDEFAGSGLKHSLQGRAIAAFKRALVARGGNGHFGFRMLKRGGRLVFGDSKHVVRSGNWHGNDTAWRMVLDLNKAFFYFDGRGRPRSRRRYFSLVDGIVAGEGDGPSAPDATPAGILVAGFSPVAVDTICATVMGFDYRNIPLLARAWEAWPLPLVGFEAHAVRCESNVRDWCGGLADLLEASHLAFTPHFGWTGRIERTQHAGAHEVLV